MNDKRINKKIRISLLQFAPALLVGAFLIVAVLQGFGSPAPVAAQADSTAPTISSVAITSDPDDDIREDVPYKARGSTWYVRPSGIYGIGDDIEVTVTFSKNVTVTGTPKLDLNIGGSSKAAEYLKADDGAVVFSYTVAEGDSDTNGVAIDANKLRLNGGSIRDGARQRCRPFPRRSGRSGRPRGGRHQAEDSSRILGPQFLYDRWVHHGW